MSMSQVEELNLEAPLLAPHERDNGDAQSVECGESCACGDGRCGRNCGEGSTCSNTGAIANLAVTAVGAGMLALPKAFACVGFGLGGCIFLLTCFLTYVSSATIVRFASQFQKRSYGDLVKARLGDTGALLLQASIIVHVVGVMIVYLIIIGDMLVGSAPEYQGLLPSLLNRHDGPSWLSRPFVLGVLLCATVLPMLLSRSLRVVARYSSTSVFLLLGLAATMIGLAGVAMYEGKSADVYFWPTIPLSPAWIIRSLTVLAVCALAFTIQFNLLPVQYSMRANNCANMLSVTKRAIGLYALLYAALASSGFILFGEDTDGDVLKSLTLVYLKTIVHAHLAKALICVIVVSTTFNLLVNFVLKVWAARDSCCALSGKQAAELTSMPFYALTLALVLVAYGTACVLPSVWFIVGLIGATACMAFSYVCPGLLMARDSKSRAARACGIGAIFLSASLSAVAIYNTLSGQFDM